MTTFQKLSNYWPNEENHLDQTRKLISNSWLKIEVKLPSNLKLKDFLRLSREAMEAAKHYSRQGEHSYFDELVQRDLAS